MRINHQRIGAAELYYATHGYHQISVPWIVGNEAYWATKPPQSGKDYATLGGNLVASGEQSFLQLMLSGTLITKAQCTTPCFRDEVHDELHHPYFMKVELIDVILPQDGRYEKEENRLNQMISRAHRFFEKYVSAEIITMGPNLFDIVEKETRIELGSYGIRQHKEHRWIFGTGLAEPRLEQVLKKVYRL